MPADQQTDTPASAHASAPAAAGVLDLAAGERQSDRETDRQTVSSL